ncbi:hypothetical protein A28LD_1567 [Idiomarina sp. A28L]|uniref:hypothetical protein n=1 Tax=Idiomarina sp. A28L TaxID=1036674 RepID=UPI0002138BAC|nr:hypothetical protein [Idiomarina sp. A28L]EGN75104.1 hypothetical protein A28LD_1567 [Idiomarina sp. A28L]
MGNETSNTRTRLISNAIAILLVVIVLFGGKFLPLERVNEQVFLALLIALSLLAYQYLDAVRMLRRQAFLSHVYKPEGRVRRLFWDSLWLRILYTVISVISALIALMLIAQLQTLEWWVLLAGIVSFVLIALLVYRLLSNETQPQYHVAIVLRVSAWINLILLAVALALVQIFWLEVPDTRYLTVFEVAEQSWQVEAAIPFVGWLLGTAAVLQDVSWHLLQQASRVEASMGLKASAWFLILSINALKLASLQVVLLGIPSIAQQMQLHGWQTAGKKIFRKSYIFTLFVLLILYVSLNHVPWQQLRQSVSVPPEVVIIDPCAEVFVAREQQQLEQQVKRQLSVQQVNSSERMQAQVTVAVTEAFSHAERGVDAFLDWNFSIQGQYQQLGYLLGATVSSAKFNDYLSDRMNEFIGAELSPALLQANTALNETFAAEMRRAGAAQSAFLDELLANSQCFEQPELTFSVGEYMDKSLVGLGIAGGAVALRFATAAGTRAAGRAGIRRVIAALFTRSASRAGAVGSGSAGALCGPAFWLCTPAIIAGTWFAVDYGLNKTDEAINRERMRAEMLLSLQNDQAQAIAELQAFYELALNDFYTELEEAQQRQFNIRRDGL